MTDRSARSSEGLDKKLLSHRLSRPRDESAVAEPVPPSRPAYVRFNRRAGQILSPQHAATAAGAEEAPTQGAGSTLAEPPPPRVVDGSDLSSWEDLARRAQSFSGATSAYVVDGDGLTVASVGDAVQERALEAGARMLVALDQASKLEGWGRRVVFPSARGILSAFAGPGEGKATMTLVLELPQSLPEEECESILRLLDRFALQSAD